MTDTIDTRHPAALIAVAERAVTDEARNALRDAAREIERLRAEVERLASRLSFAQGNAALSHNENCECHAACLPLKYDRLRAAFATAREREGKLREAARPHTACLGKQPAGVGPQTFGIWCCQECAGCRLAAVLAEGDGEEKP